MSIIEKIKKINPIVFLIIIFGFLGFFASLTLTIEKMHLLADGGYVPSCNINPLFSCGKVMSSKYSEVFGVTWSLFGLAGYGAAILMGIILGENRQLPRWLAYLMTIGMFGAFALSTVFMFITAYIIQAFCPWCLASAVSATSIFFGLIHLNIKRNNYHLSEELITKLRGYLRKQYLTLFAFFWFVALFVMMYLPFYLASNFDIFIFIN